MSATALARLPSAFGLDPTPRHGDLGKKGYRSLYVSNRFAREAQRHKLEPWLKANAWLETNGQWEHPQHGVHSFVKAIWLQLLASWHERIALDAQRLPVMRKPPFAWRRFRQLRRAERPSVAQWLYSMGGVYVPRPGEPLPEHQACEEELLAILGGVQPGHDPGWYLPGTTIDWTWESAYELMFDRWLTGEAERRGWDWAGWNEHPKSFQLPMGKKMGRLAAIKVLW